MYIFAVVKYGKPFIVHPQKRLLHFFHLELGTTDIDTILLHLETVVTIPPLLLRSAIH